ncbi:MAG: DUF4236 domain-containing protein [Candidatus Hydrogenedentes bacterium]|nr:DUF4236 domain-containing protein [Candidatus Hydrogenedentota bacterium]
MAFRFRKSIRIAPGVRMSFSKSGIGLSAGVKGARIGVNSRGTYTSLGIPGTGISMLNYHGNSKSIRRSAISIPDDYVLTSEFGEVQVTHTVRGIPKYSIEISHEGINKFQVIKGDSQEDVEQKACAKMRQWNEIWERSQILEQERSARQSRANAIAEKKKLASEQTEEAQALLAELDGILIYTLGVDDTIDWASLKGPKSYPEPRPEEPQLPTPPIEPELPRKHRRDDAKYEVRPDLLGKLFKSIHAKRLAEAETLYLADHARWESIARSIYSEYESRRNEHLQLVHRLESQYRSELDAWERRREVYSQRWQVRSDYVDAKRNRYFAGDSRVVQDYCELVLGNSKYPDYFPQAYELLYEVDDKLLVVDYQIPAPEALPTCCEIRYIQSKDEFVEKEIGQAHRNKAFSKAAYEIALRTLHELFEADRADALLEIVFNGYVATVDSRSGEDVELCIMTVKAEKNRFLSIQLDRIESKECFDSLGGRCKSPLHKLVPVEPIRSATPRD